MNDNKEKWVINYRILSPSLLPALPNFSYIHPFLIRPYLGLEISASKDFWAAASQGHLPAPLHPGRDILLMLGSWTEKPATIQELAHKNLPTSPLLSIFSTCSLEPDTQEQPLKSMGWRGQSPRSASLGPKWLYGSRSILRAVKSHNPDLMWAWSRSILLRQKKKKNN